MSRYRLHVNGEKTEQEVEGKSPGKALVELCARLDLTLVSQDGRYGKATHPDTGSTLQSVSALTMPYGRRKLDPQERTTRL